MNQTHEVWGEVRASSCCWKLGSSCLIFGKLWKMRDDSEVRYRESCLSEHLSLSAMTFCIPSFRLGIT